MTASLEQLVTKYFLAIKGVAAVYLFGSQVKPETVSRTSDIDLAVLFLHPDKPNAVTLLKMRDELADIFGREVDLLNLNDADPIIAMQVLQAGKPVFVPNQRVCDEWVMRLVTDYSDLKDMRFPIEEQFLKELRE